MGYGWDCIHSFSKFCVVQSLKALDDHEISCVLHQAKIKILGLFTQFGFIFALFFCFLFVFFLINLPVMFSESVLHVNMKNDFSFKEH